MKKIEKKPAAKTATPKGGKPAASAPSGKAKPAGKAAPVAEAKAKPKASKPAVTPERIAAAEQRASEAPYRKMRKYTHPKLGELADTTEKVANIRKAIRSRESGPLLHKEFMKFLVHLEAEKKDWAARPSKAKPKAEKTVVGGAKPAAKGAKVAEAKIKEALGKNTSLEGASAKLAALKGKKPAAAPAGKAKVSATAPAGKGKAAALVKGAKPAGKAKLAA